MLPCGVRTFLSPKRAGATIYPPAIYFIPLPNPSPKTPTLRIDALSIRDRIFLVLIRLSLLALLSTVLLPLRAQNDPVKMTPEFPLTFPLAQNDTDVTVKYPILINPGCIIKPGMVLRVMYILHNPNGNADGSTDLALAHKGNLENSFSRTAPTSDGKQKLPPEMAHELEGYRRTVWQVSNNFILAMAQLPTDSMHLIFLPNPNDNRNLQDEHFSFFDGLFIGLPDGKVTALAVENDSHADRAGIKADDEILSVGGTPVQGDLSRFANAYAATKKNATDSDATSYPMVVKSPGKEPRTVNIPMPPSLKGGLMDGFK